MVELKKRKVETRKTEAEDKLKLLHNCDCQPKTYKSIWSCIHRITSFEWTDSDQLAYLNTLLLLYLADGPVHASFACIESNWHTRQSTAANSVPCPSPGRNEGENRLNMLPSKHHYRPANGRGGGSGGCERQREQRGDDMKTYIQFQYWKIWLAIQHL